MVSYVYDSVLDHSEPQKLRYILDAATRFNLELRLRSAESDEGYEINKYIISPSNQKDWEAFVSDLSTTIPDSHWHPLTQEDEMRMIYPARKRAISLQEEIENSPIVLNSSIDSWRGIASYNAKLRQRLEEEIPLYFTYNWVLPSSEEACRIWLKALLESLWKLSLGCAIRLSGEIKPHLDTHIQTLVLRVFSWEDLEALRQKINFDMTNSGWRNAPTEIFLGAKPIHISTIGSFLAQIRRC